MIWATVYSFDFDMVQFPIFDADGYPVQKRGLTGYAGLYFVGLPWLHNAKSGLLFGVGEESAYITGHIVNRDPPVFPIWNASAAQELSYEI